MRKKLLLAILSLGVLLPCVVGAEQTSTNLDSVDEGNNSANTQVTVGNVAVPTYGVAIIWDDMTFDWVYNPELNKFEWKPSSSCNPAWITSLEEFLEYEGRVYLDETCTESTDLYNSENFDEYYVLYERESAAIGIEDLSENGQITPSIKWTADDKYNDVTAKFQYYKKSCSLINSQAAYDIAKDLTMYSDNSCTEKLMTVPTYEPGKYYVYASKETDLLTEEISNDGRHSSAGGGYVDGLIFNIDEVINNQYLLSLKLDGGSTIPTAGDKIGSITIKIKASEYNN